MRKTTLFIILLIVLSVVTAGCASTEKPPETQQRAIDKAMSRHAYEPVNDVEFNNYNRRQIIADDPTTILWCTSAFPIPSSPLFTVPIVGKLTSGGKRPYPTQFCKNYESSEYFPELPGPDGMYGSSGEYRYGFTPADVYADWYGLPTFCTTAPTV